jgi:hypothetical protein
METIVAVARDRKDEGESLLAFVGRMAPRRWCRMSHWCTGTTFVGGHVKGNK